MGSADTPSRPASPLPWATVLVTVATMLIFSSEKAFEALIYQRAKIFSGEPWRLWTGHLVHFGSSHLAWDVAVFLPAGCWLETLRPRAARWFYLVSPGFISGLLLIFDAQLERYAGLSGVAIGTLLLLALVQLRERRESPWFWWAVIVLIAAKVSIELLKGTPLLVSDFQNIRNVPLAHIGGLVGGALCWLISARQAPGNASN